VHELREHERVQLEKTNGQQENVLLPT